MLPMLSTHLHLGTCQWQEDDRTSHEYGHRCWSQPLRSCGTFSSFPPHPQMFCSCNMSDWLLTMNRYPAAALASSTAAPLNGALLRLYGEPAMAALRPTLALNSLAPCSLAVASDGTGCRVLTTQGQTSTHSLHPFSPLAEIPCSGSSTDILPASTSKS